MKITDVRVKKVERQGQMLAVASVTFDDEFVVHDIKVIDGNNGMFIAMPNKKQTNGEYRDVAHPIKSDFRKILSDAILEAYNASENKNN